MSSASALERTALAGRAAAAIAALTAYAVKKRRESGDWEAAIVRATEQTQTTAGKEKDVQPFARTLLVI